MQVMDVSKEIKALEEQILMLKSIKPSTTKSNKILLVEEYRNYLESTKNAIEIDLDPTEYIRKLRNKGDFY